MEFVELNLETFTKINYFTCYHVVCMVYQIVHMVYQIVLIDTAKQGKDTYLHK